MKPQKLLASTKEFVPNVGVFKEFLEFLKEYKIVGLAIGVVMGVASTSLVKSLVENIIMPLITPFLAGGAWKTAVFTVGPFNFGWGAFLAETINFTMMALVVFLVAKKILKEEKVGKK
jgi:large conductance mechanosensitive channel